MQPTWVEHPKSIIRKYLYYFHVFFTHFKMLLQAIVFFFGFQNLQLNCRSIYSSNLQLNCRIKKVNSEMTANPENFDVNLDWNVLNNTCFCGSAAQRIFLQKYVLDYNFALKIASTILFSDHDFRISSLHSHTNLFKILFFYSTVKL